MKGVFRRFQPKYKSSSRGVHWNSLLAPLTNWVTKFAIKICRVYEFVNSKLLSLSIAPNVFIFFQRGTAWTVQQLDKNLSVSR